MIRLNNNSVNENVILTLSENVTLTAGTVYFLFKFTDEEKNTDLLFSASDESTNIIRYNKFTITLTGETETNLTGGTINFGCGKFKYEVYEMSDRNNLLIDGTTGIILEKGIVQINGCDETIITKSYDPGTTYKKYKSYNG